MAKRKDRLAAAMRGGADGMAARLMAEGMGEAPALAIEARAKAMEASGSLPQPKAPEPGPPAPPEGGEDAEALRAACEGLPPDQARLLAAMLALARARPHPSGRIAYSDAELMAAARLRAVGAYRAAMAALAAGGLARLMVVGSREPTPAFELPWAPGGAHARDE